MTRCGRLRSFGTAKRALAQAGAHINFDATRRLHRHANAEKAWVAQLVEHVLGKDEVAGSIPVPGSSIRQTKSQRVASLENAPFSLTTKTTTPNPPDPK